MRAEKLGELIAELRDTLKKHGDLPVYQIEGDCDEEKPDVSFGIEEATDTDITEPWYKPKRVVF